MRADVVESIYWAGTESGLMDVHSLAGPGVICATDGLKSSKSSRSSGRAEFGVACRALEDSLTHNKPIAVLTDCKGFRTVSSNWVGEGKDPLLLYSSDGHRLACIINVLQQRVDLRLFATFVKIRAHESPPTRRLADGRTRDEMITTM